MNLGIHGFDLSTEMDLINSKLFTLFQDFKDGDIEYNYKIPNGDGTYPSKVFAKEGAVPSILPGCPSYYLSH